MMDAEKISIPKVSKQYKRQQFVDPELSLPHWQAEYPQLSKHHIKEALVDIHTYLAHSGILPSQKEVEGLLKKELQVHLKKRKIILERLRSESFFQIIQVAYPNLTDEQIKQSITTVIFEIENHPHLISSSTGIYRLSGLLYDLNFEYNQRHRPQSLDTSTQTPLIEKKDDRETLVFFLATLFSEIRNNALLLTPIVVSILLQSYFVILTQINLRQMGSYVNPMTEAATLALAIPLARAIQVAKQQTRERKKRME